MGTSRANVALLWISQALSALGTSVSSLAYPLLVLDIGGTALEAGLVGTVTAATGLVTRLPGGVVADRFRYRRVMLFADAARALVVGTLAVTVVVGSISLPLILIAVAVEVALGSMFGPAEFSLLRLIVEPGERALAVGRMQSRSALAGLIGPALGGALYGVWPALPFLVDAGSYVVSAALVAAMRGTGGLRASRADARRAGVLAGWRWVRQERFLLTAAIWVSALTAVFGAVGLALLIFARDRGAEPAEIGAMFAISAAGGLAGAILTPAVQRRLPPARILQVAVLVDVSATVAILPVRSPYVIGMLGAAAFFLAPAVTASVFGEVSRRCPDELVGRAQSAVTLVTGAFAPLAPAAIGGIVDQVGVTVAVAVCAGAFAVLAVASWVLPGFRDAG
ncbi:MFS transporter [Microbacterium neungamense]|uniref:MFS transporter n=1 Tax=Microbacterium neungamense TaxID=2810535 RepID=UPI00217D74A3|nr:MFS transporter [Microbacterium neungamense]UWF77741.1 MFS transporter [Microbacterium neungamense]